jgi:hypothetical protein
MMCGDVWWCQGKTMPPQPAHRASFRGSGATIQVCLATSNPQRLELPSHSNEYIGVVRARVAAHYGQVAAKLRLLCAGKFMLIFLRLFAVSAFFAVTSFSCCMLSAGFWLLVWHVVWLVVWLVHMVTSQVLQYWFSM